MRELRRLAWAAVVAAATAAPGAAQVSGTGSGLTSVSGSAATSGGFGTGVGGTSSSSGSLAGSTGGSALSTQTAVTQQAAPSLSISTTTPSTNSAINSSNFLGRTYANPYYLGVYANNTNTSAQPGGFGTVLFQNSSALGGGQIAFAGTVNAATTATGTGGVRGGVGGTGGAGSSLSGNVGSVVPLSRTMAYPARVQFSHPPVATTQVMADVRGAIDRAAMIANPAGVQMVMDGNTVVLRGAVRDEDESRLVEGLVRLTPGVGLIKNELAFPTRP